VELLREVRQAHKGHGHHPHLHTTTGEKLMSKRDLALDSLTRICEIQQRLINQLIAMEQNSYARGYEDGMAAQAEVDIALNEIASGKPK
jgi:hypothetical protein